MPVMTSSRKLVTTRKCRKRSKGTKRVNHSSSVWVLIFGFAELLRVVQVEVKRAAQPDHGVQAEEDEDADQQAGHAEKDHVQQRIILAVQRVGVGFVFGEADRRAGMTLLAGGQDVGLGEV